jgi:hypothetical protein
VICTSRIGSLCVCLALALAACGCGSSTSTKTSTAVTTSAAVTQTSSVKRQLSAPALHLSILSPRVGAHTASTLTVRVAVSGAPPGSTQRFRYVLDRRLTRFGSARLTFHGLASGRHRLEVLLAARATGHATTTFVVRAPTPVAIPMPVQPQPTASTPAAAPTTPNIPTPPQHTTSPQHSTTTSPPQHTTTSPPPSSGGIPQGGGGDGDGDNSGGPSDGDGNI